MDTSHDKLEDLYDSLIWNRFKNFNGSPFLEDDHAYVFMINMDWLPYKDLTYSAGVIYLSLFNLRRSMHYQLKNICLIRIIPEPREPVNLL